MAGPTTGGSLTHLVGEVDKQCAVVGAAIRQHIRLENVPHVLGIEQLQDVLAHLVHVGEGGGGQLQDDLTHLLVHVGGCERATGVRGAAGEASRSSMRGPEG